MTTVDHRNRCTECGEFVFFSANRHTCLPKWLVWDKDMPLNDAIESKSCTVFADDSSKAAEVYHARIDDLDTPERIVAYVLEYSYIGQYKYTLDEGDEEVIERARELLRSVTRTYEVRREMVPSYTAAQVEKERNDST